MEMDSIEFPAVSDLIQESDEEWLETFDDALDFGSAVDRLIVLKDPVQGIEQAVLIQILEHHLIDRLLQELSEIPALLCEQILEDLGKMREIFRREDQKDVGDSGLSDLFKDSCFRCEILFLA